MSKNIEVDIAEAAVASKILKNLKNKEFEELGAIKVQFADDLTLLVPFDDYYDSRQDASELHRMVHDEFASDKATSVSIQAISVMEESIRRSLKMAKEFRSLVLSKKKKQRLQVGLLDKIIEELDSVCPCDDFATFLEHILNEDAEDTVPNLGEYICQS